MIVIYGAPWCGWCMKAKKLAEDYALPYTWENVDDEKVKQELKKQLQSVNPEAKTIPQIWWNGNYIGGYESFAQEVEDTRNYGQDKI